MPTPYYLDWTHCCLQGCSWIEGNKSSLQPDRLCVVQGRRKTTPSGLVLLWSADLNSDYKPVITRLQMSHMYFAYKRRPSQGGRVIYDLAKLVNSNSTQEDYCNALDKKLAEINFDCDPNNTLTEVLKCVEISAASNIGVIKNNKN